MKIIKLNEETFEDAVKNGGSEVTTAAKQIDAVGDDVINLYNDGEDDIRDILDEALENSLDAQGDPQGAQNILLIGEAGTGKTSRVKSWARHRGVNLVQKDAKTLDPSDMGGIVARKYDTEKGKQTNTATKLTNTEFDQLDQPNSVLFLDELNRAPSDVKGSLLTLIQDHVVNDVEAKGGTRLLKGFLFTIAAINPASSGKYDVEPLDTAMLSRFGSHTITSNSAMALKYFKKLYTMGTPRNEKHARKNAGRYAIAQRLLTSPDFSWDTSEDINALDDRYSPLNNRTLTNLLNACDGTRKSFLDHWDFYCNPDKKAMAEDILDDYVDVDDKANDALAKGAEINGEENPFAKREENAFDKLNKLF